ncbi:MAG TPA: extracellular solute-binding protein [bacterium]|nr:extracellular solute-binding protein [bacterium]
MKSPIRVMCVALTIALVGGMVIAPLAAAPQETISLAFSAGYKEDVLRANIAKFQQATGVQVQIDASPYDDLYKKTLLSLSTSANRYDVMFMDEVWIPGLARFLMPLDDLAKQLDVKDFVPATMQAGVYQGRLYALPVDPNVQLFIYRKDVFQQRGLQVPGTWDEVLHDAQVLNDPGKDVSGIVTTAGSDLQTALDTLLLIWSYGGDVLGKDGRASADTPEARRGVDMFLQLLRYAPPGVQSYSYPDITKAIQLGRAMMAIQWAGGARPMEDPASSIVAGKLGYALMPKGTRRAPMRGVWVIGIANTTQHRDAAWKFAQWITGREFGRDSVLYPAKAAAMHSARVSVLTDPKVIESLPYAPALLANLKVSWTRVRVPQYPDIQEAVREVAADITTGRIPVSDGLKSLDAKIDRIMEK